MGFLSYVSNGVLLEDQPWERGRKERGETGHGRKKTRRDEKEEREI